MVEDSRASQNWKKLGWSAKNSEEKKWTGVQLKKLTDAVCVWK